jgi:hypothetical protein
MIRAGTSLTFAPTILVTDGTITACEDNPGDRRNDHRVRRNHSLVSNCNGYVPSGHQVAEGTGETPETRNCQMRLGGDRYQCVGEKYSSTYSQ